MQSSNEYTDARTDMPDPIDPPSVDELLRVSLIICLHISSAASLLSHLQQSRTSDASIRDVLQCLERNIRTVPNTFPTASVNHIDSQFVIRIPVGDKSSLLLLIAIRQW